MKRKFKSGATSTVKVRLELIPYNALKELAKRFELGLERHKEGSYNNLQNESALYDKEWLIERCSHGIDHLYRCIEKLSGKLRDIDNDAAAVAWCGIVLTEAFTKLNLNVAPTLGNSPKPVKYRGRKGTKR